MANEVVNESKRLSKSNFKIEMEEQLEGFSFQQKVKFVRRCAFHALPYLYAKGDMKFWSEETRLNYIWVVFNALDYCSAAEILRDSEIDVKKIRDAANATYAKANIAYTKVNTFHVSNAAYAVADAAYAVYTADTAYVIDAAYATYRFNKTQIYSVLCKELKAIANNQAPAKAQIDPALIQNFVEALNQENCYYWAKLYKNIFENNFELDAKELKQRLSVPEEIKAQGAAAVGNYMEQLLEQGAKRLNESRILILGDKGAGKTCLARRLIEPNAKMTTVDESTAGVDTSIWTLEKTDSQEPTNVRIWDFAGHTVTHAVHQFFLSERCLYILVYDGRLDNGSSLEYWLDHMKNYGGESQAIIVVNEKDQHKIEIPVNKLSAKYPIHSVHYFSIADPQQVDEFRQKVAQYISNNPSWSEQLLPNSYYSVKEELERLFDCGETDNRNDKFNEHISITEFNEIADFNGIADTKQLLKDLSALGISLWYPELEKYGKLVLNPEWISHGVYKIINWLSNKNREVGLVQKVYTISLDDLTQVFKGDKDEARFGAEHHEFLFDLIKHYKLAYEQQNDASVLIFPHLLKEDLPHKDKMPTFLVGESLMLEYRAGQPLPPDTISRFIVSHNKQIKGDLVWRSGVVLADRENKNTIALVNEDDRIISISAKGNNKSAFIAELRDTMNDIFASYKSDNPELFVEVTPFGPQGEVINLAKPLLLPQNQIANHVAKEQNYFEHNSGQLIDLKETATNYNINIQAGQVNLGGEVHTDNSTTINYQDCNFELQGSLNDLVHELESAGQLEQAKQLESAVAALEKAENCETPSEVKKSGVGNRMKRIVEDMGDKNSSLYKAIEGTKSGVDIAQNLADKYNSIADWCGLPQVPKVFLKK